jgi:hypothetical protein
MMRLDISITVGAIALGEVEAADGAGCAVVSLGVPSELGIAFSAAMPAVPLCFFTGSHAVRELLAS